MDALIQLISAPKLEKGNYQELVDKLKKCIETDKNMVVVTLAVKALGLLCMGLRSEFTIYARPLVPTLLEKFKEKKLIPEVHTTLNAIEDKCKVLVDSIEDISNAANNKAPPVKENTLIWVEKSLSKTNKTELGKASKPLGEIFLKLADDSTGSVRDEACKAMGRLMWVVGERGCVTMMEKLDKIKSQKVTDYAATLGPPPADKPKPATKSVAPAPAPATSSVAAPAKKPALDRFEVTDEDTPAAPKKVPARLLSRLAKKPEQAEAPETKPPSPKKAPAPAAAKPSTIKR
eukprot:GEZU01014403.1.p1 GENE.GEZU01014403.1~~GEZU01014403.1.p1  ORF type:complete len:290 (+),score=59.79 GEZU01014403.1:2-871(+)